ncbi:MAG: phosphate signaling complex protein PhoU [Bdellovibrionota bacterium]|nr:phosphate signaling complex protein PhoU [Deltaproteobacteria bacterium]
MSKHLRNDLQHLKKELLFIGMTVEEAVEKSMRAFRKGDVDTARKIIEDDEVINAKEVEIEEECLKLLALYQPVAKDLRFLATVIKINNDLERMGDISAKISKRTISMAKELPIELPDQLKEMIQVTKTMVKDSLDAFFRQDASDSRQICKRDVIVDKLNKEIFRLVREKMQADPNNIDQYLDIVTATKSIERIADLATNIAQDVVYMVEGEIIRHKFLD